MEKRVVFVVIDMDINEPVAVFLSPERAKESYPGRQYYFQAFELQD